MRTCRGIAQGSGIGVAAGLVGAALCFAAGAASAQNLPKQEAWKQQPLKFAGSQLEPIKWSELAGWAADDHLAAFAAYQAGCRASRKKPRSDDHVQISGALGNVCRKAIELHPQDSDTARAFFEQNFQPVRIARLGEGEGLVTGYYEPIVAGSRFPSPEFSVPIYRRPRDLVADGYKAGSTAFPNKGGRIGRRTGNNEFVPYYDRAAIEAGALDGQQLEICWIKDPLDLVAIQIEGSARVILEDGTPLRISYDSHNGYSYSSIERVLIERNLISRKELSRERIREWTAAHPEEAAKARGTNRAYMFFRITGLTNDGEPVGAQGVPLTPGRSIAVDRVHEYGTPFFIEGNLPVESPKPATPFGRLMIAQDTGSAIVGPARADLYLGAGDEAGRVAGRIKHRGRFAMLLPRELDIVTAGSDMPLPVPKPKIAESADAPVSSMGKAIARQDDKGKAVPAASGAITDGRHVPSSAAKTKIAVLQAEKPGDNSKVKSLGARASMDGRHPPLPAPKTKILVTEGNKVATEGRKPGGKGNGESTDTSWTVAGKHKSQSSAKSKLSDIDPGKETRKQDGKGKTDAAKPGAIATGKSTSGPKTRIAETEARKETGKHDGKGKAASAGSGRIASGKPVPSSAKSKSVEVEPKKQNGKGKADSGKARVMSAGEEGKAAAKPGRQAASTRKSSGAVN
jgi:membrane-bound lytic murein transglycosylase A